MGCKDRGVCFFLYPLPVHLFPEIRELLNNMGITTINPAEMGLSSQEGSRI